MQKDRTILFGTLFAVLAAALAACSSGTTIVPNSASADGAHASTPGSSVDAPSIPGRGRYGVSAHYVVFKQVWIKPTIVVIGAQSADDYLKAFPASTRIGGATIVYPDGSKQVANEQGEFDAGMSSYAQAHPEKFNGTDIVVHVDSPATASLKAITKIFAPSESEEKNIESGVIPPGTKPADSPKPGAVVRPDGYIWSCDPKEYDSPRLDSAVEGWDYERSVTTLKGAWYEPHFYTCGTDQPSDALEWSSTGWRTYEHIYDEWSVTAVFKYGFVGQKVALWWSPSYYGVPQNIHETLIEIRKKWSCC